MERGAKLTMIRLAWIDRFIFHTFLMSLLVMPFSIALFEIAMGCTILFWIVKLLVRKERIDIPPLGWPFLIFLFVTIASAAASDYKSQALRGVWEVTRYTITFFIVTDMIQSAEQVKKVVWVLAFSTGVWVIAGIIHQFLIVKRPLFDLLQFFSLGNKNSIGQYLQMVLAILFGLLLNNSFRPRERRVLAAISLVSLFALFLSGSKTMWVAMILTLFIFALLKRSLKVLVGTGSLVLLLAAAALISGQVRNMGLSILKAADAHSMQIRYIGWKQSYQMFIDHPFLGVGPKCFMDARDKYKVISDFGQAHNLVLHVACEMGIVGVGGLISWIGFYIYFMATYREKVKNPIYSGLWFGGVGYLVTLAIGGITEPTIGGEHSQLFMTLVGLMHAGHWRRWLYRVTSCRGAPARRRKGPGHR
jgi:O-antigen ligase